MCLPWYGGLCNCPHCVHKCHGVLRLLRLSLCEQSAWMKHGLHVWPRAHKRLVQDSAALHEHPPFTHLHNLWTKRHTLPRLLRSHMYMHSQPMLPLGTPSATACTAAAHACGFASGAALGIPAPWSGQCR